MQQVYDGHFDAWSNDYFKFLGLSEEKGYYFYSFKQNWA